MANLTITMSPNKVAKLKISQFGSKLNKNLIKGFARAGAIHERQMKINVSGPSRGNFPYPGVVTGELRRSIGFKAHTVPGGPQLVSGPGKDYAVHLELGTSYISPPLAFVWPSFEQKQSEMLDQIENAIMRPLI